MYLGYTYRPRSCQLDFGGWEEDLRRWESTKSSSLQIIPLDQCSSVLPSFGYKTFYFFFFYTFHIFPVRSQWRKSSFVYLCWTLLFSCLKRYFTTQHCNVLWITVHPGWLVQRNSLDQSPLFSGLFAYFIIHRNNKMFHNRSYVVQPY